MHTSTRLIALATLTLATFAAHAQDAAAPAVPAEAAVDIQLTVDSGSVLVSTGGEFTQAAPGQALVPGHRVLVAEDASATLTYGNGCQKALASAGVYTINADCNADRGLAVPSAGVIAGVVGSVALIAVAAGGGGGSDSPPVSR